MDEIIRQIKAQQEINFKNVEEQIQKAYLEHVKSKIERYFETLTADMLLEKPEECEYTRLELILGQFRHLMWHVGVSSAITFNAKHEWNEFTGLNGFRKIIEG